MLRSKRAAKLNEAANESPDRTMSFSFDFEESSDVVNGRCNGTDVEDIRALQLGEAQRYQP